MLRLLLAALVAGLVASALVALGERLGQRWSAGAPSTLPALAWMLYAPLVCIGSLTLPASRAEWSEVDGDARAVVFVAWALALLAGGRLLRSRLATRRDRSPGATGRADRG